MDEITTTTLTTDEAKKAIGDNLALAEHAVRTAMLIACNLTNDGPKAEEIIQIEKTIMEKLEEMRKQIEGLSTN